MLSGSAFAAALVCIVGITLAGGSPRELLGMGTGAHAAPAATAVANEPEPGDTMDSAAFALKPLFNVLDCEGEGVIRPNEIDEHIAQVLSVYDRDGSRTVSRNEYLRSAAGAARERQGALFDGSDTKKDGVLSAKELGRHVAALIAEVDSNRDGEVTKLELEQRSRALRDPR
jgi:hypothetical protein